jgi:hypothetical protein
MGPVYTCPQKEQLAAAPGIRHLRRILFMQDQSADVGSPF